MIYGILAYNKVLHVMQNLVINRVLAYCIQAEEILQKISWKLNIYE